MEFIYKFFFVTTLRKESLRSLWQFRSPYNIDLLQQRIVKDGAYLILPHKPTRTMVYLFVWCPHTVKYLVILFSQVTELVSTGQLL